MAISDEHTPFSRPGFIVAAVVIAVIAVTGVVIGVINTTSKPSSTTTAPSSANSPSIAPSVPVPTQPAGGGASVCGLDGEVLDGTVSIAPEAQWQYQGTTAYPTSSEFGPGATDPAGFRYCFQHSPEGALFTAANAAVMATDQALLPAWMDYFVAEGPHRDSFLQASASEATTTQGARIEITGFRVLAYDGETARIDLVLRGSLSGRTITMSMVYELVWQGGDWKLLIDDPDSPIDVATIPDSSGYIPWGS